MYLGIDVSKMKLDYSLRTAGKELRNGILKNEFSEIVSLLQELKDDASANESVLVVCAEHTGDYTSYLKSACGITNTVLYLESGAGIKLSSGLQRGKNDKIDAARIATYAERFSDALRPYKEPRMEVARLRKMLMERNLYVKDVAKYKRMLKEQTATVGNILGESFRRRFEEIIDVLQNHIRELEAAIRQMLSASEELRRQECLLRSVDGVGEMLAWKVIAATDAFEQFEKPRKFCCHAGIAPFAYHSGSSIRSAWHVSHRADKSIKELLHMSALAAISVKQGPFKDYYIRKVEEGKNKMSVLNAIRAKIVHAMFAVVRNNTMFDKNYNISLA